MHERSDQHCTPAMKLLKRSSQLAPPWKVMSSLPMPALQLCVLTVGSWVALTPV